MFKELEFIVSILESTMDTSALIDSLEKAGFQKWDPPDAAPGAVWYMGNHGFLNFWEGGLTQSVIWGADYYFKDVSKKYNLVSRGRFVWTGL